MSENYDWNTEKETEPVEIVEETTEDVVEETTKSEKVAEELNIEASIAAEDDDKVAKENNVIGSSTTKKSGGRKKKSALTPNASGVISSGSVTESEPVKAKVAKPKKDKIAVYSTKNVTWNGVGKVYRGYNIVTQEQADKWATRSHIRLATPEEIAREFGE